MSNLWGPFQIYGSPAVPGMFACVSRLSSITATMSDLARTRGHRQWVKPFFLGGGGNTTHNFHYLSMGNTSRRSVPLQIFRRQAQCRTRTYNQET